MYVIVNVYSEVNKITLFIQIPGLLNEYNFNTAMFNSLD
jgi:hypothetical protein